MELEFKTRNNKQLEAAEYWCDDTTEQLLFGGAKAGGKSFLGASLIFGDALIYPGDPLFHRAPGIDRPA
jgi:phage terminase large subunit